MFVHNSFVCTTRVETASATLLRSYRSPDDDGFDYNIWEAIRATSAAPIYFDAIEFGKPPEKYYDGGIRNNNPINHAFWETYAIWGRDANIGFGIFGHQIVRACTEIATQTEQTAADFIRNHQHQYPVNQSYFRFNIPHGLKEIQLDEWQMRLSEAEQAIYARDAVLHYGAAEDIFSRALGGASERSLQQGDTRVLNAKDYLAAICDRQGDLRKGEQLYKEILAAREKSLGMTDPLTWKTVSDLVGIYDYEGRVQEAKDFYLRALEGLEAHAEVGTG
ncbi:acyl transferase/acyl hydrolase/lysophospholipase [Lasiosphaeria ovina]|uniref:Acyl transferase/acyl hydrolase/lysophospholipase n=1 Tax=Lasiosphaeria ovina TaxID=92902 RepID=A0AAE0K409_9PEZI|nr:acyl transferase/acyl hydrolase/lysophospholipase [Lasiosphaeria ovina]